MSRPRSQKRKPQYQFQLLEPRQLLAGINLDAGTGILTITGSDASEAAYVNTTQAGQTSAWLQNFGVRLFDSTSVSEIVFYAQGGDDWFRNDTSIPSSAYGEAGNDTLIGGSGDDSFFGGDHDDRLIGNSGNDTLLGQSGDDIILGGIGNDYADGGNGNDRMFGQEGDDTLLGGFGDDQMEGRAGDDYLNGNEGFDRLQGNNGSDDLRGGSQADIIAGGYGDDTLLGQDGADQLYGEFGDDWVSGGAGSDMIFGQQGNDRLRGDEGNDQLFGGDDNDHLSGESGDDVIQGQAGDDLIVGDAGNDYLRGNNGDDQILGGFGDDTLVGDYGNDDLRGNEDRDQIFGGYGDDTLRGGLGDDDVYGQQDSDHLFGDDGHDRLYAGSGSDTIHGGSGLDDLFGEQGSDDLYGDDGDDDLYGGSGHDRLTGGLGNDDYYDSGSDDLFDDSEDYSSNGDFELRSTISNLNTNNRTFSLLGITVDYSNAHVEGPLTNGTFVKAEGLYDGAQVIAHEVEVENANNDPDNFKARGLVTNLDTTAQTFTFMGFTVNYNSAEVHGTLSENANVEVSGNLSGSIINAREVEVGFANDDNTGNIDSNFELRGVVANLNASTKTFSLLGVLVHYENAEFIDQFNNGSFVKVDGEFDGSQILARQVELDAFDDNGENVEATGVISDLDTNAQTFSFLGLTINYSGAEIEGSLANGNSVDVEGFFENFVIDAHRIRPAQ